MSRAAAWFVAVATLCVGLAGHYHGHVLYLARLNVSPAADISTHTGPLADTTQRGSADSPGRCENARPERVVVLVVDGMGWEHAMARPAFRGMAQAGGGHPLLAGFPSFTWPGLTTLGTGLPPEVHGVRINDTDFDGAQLDSVSKQAHARGIPVRFTPRGLPSFPRLLALPPDAERSKAATIGPGPALHWVYFEEVDIAGHAHGASSDEYDAAVLRAEGELIALRDQLDPCADTLVVVSDHGHLARGGHGGLEPEVVRATFLASGAGVEPVGVGTPRPMTTFAPWLGARLGFTYQPQWRAPETPNLTHRGAAAVLVFLALAASGAFFAQRILRMQARDLLPTLVYGAIFAAGYFALGYGLSWSIPRGEVGFTGETAIIAAVGIGIGLLVARRDRRVQECWGHALTWGVPYATVSVYCGLDTRALTGPTSSWLLLLAATVAFYACIGYGARALLTAFAWDRLRSSDGD